MGNESRFENFFNIEYGILSIDCESMLTISCDEGFCAMAGCTADEVRGGMSADVFFDADTVTALGELFKLGIDSMNCYEHLIRTADGEDIPVTDLVTIIKEDGRKTARLIFNRPVGQQISSLSGIASLRAFDTVLAGIPGAAAIYEYDGNRLTILKATDKYYTTLGFKDKAQHSGRVGGLMRTEDIAELSQKLVVCFKDNSELEADYKLYCPDGVDRWIAAKGKPLQASGGRKLIFVVLTDITREKKQEHEIKKQNKFFELIARSTSEIYFDYDVVRDIFHLPGSENYISRYTGSVRNYFSEKKYADNVHPDDSAELERCLAAARSGEVISGSVEYRTRAFDDDYTWYKLQYTSSPDDDGTVTNIYGRITSIETEQMLKKRIDSDKKLIERLSERDLVTGLYNRHTFKEKASKFISAIEDKKCYAIVYSDINDFSYVNENFGYDAGNRMLYDFAELIQKSDALIYGCRIYSDFYVSLCCAESRDKMIRLVNKVNSEFAELQKIHYPASDINISSGMFFINSRDIDVTIAMDNANLARRSVKGSDNLLCGIYSERMRKERLRDQSIASEVKTAMDAGMIELFLQPKFDLKTREIIGAEALARWRNHDGSYKMPYEFIGVLEKVGLIIEFDFYMYEQVLKSYVRWKQEGRRLIPISVNFSRVHSSKDNFVERVNSLADKYGVDKGLIEIEITESAFVEDVNIMIRYMNKLREHGFRIDIDDFGMGYSSLSVLLNAPIDIVKVDKVFIDNIATNKLEREYVKQICRLIATTHKEVIFEGVETEEQASFLSAIGYNMAQGWLFDKAISVREFEDKYLPM